VGFARVVDEQGGLGLLLVGHADKASLSEMVIACEGIGERELPHHNETTGVFFSIGSAQPDVSTNKPALRFMGVGIGIREIGVMLSHAVRSRGFESAEEWGKRVIYCIVVCRMIASE